MLEFQGFMNLHKKAKNGRNSFKYYPEIKRAQKNQIDTTNLAVWMQLCRVAFLINSIEMCLHLIQTKLTPELIPYSFAMWRMG